MADDPVDSEVQKLIREELMRWFPAVSEDCIDENIDYLMEAVAGEESALAPVTPPDDRTALLAMLQHIKAAVEAGDVTGMCVILSQPERNMSMLYSIPADFYTWMGFMQMALLRISRGES